MYTLTLARLFEMPKRYEIRGIPATLDFLDANREHIPFDTRLMLTKELAMSGLDALSDGDLTHSAVEVMRLPSVVRGSDNRTGPEPLSTDTQRAECAAGPTETPRPSSRRCEEQPWAQPQRRVVR
jgi:hypothetical protein